MNAGRRLFATVAALVLGSGCATVYSARIQPTSSSGDRLLGEVAQITLERDDSVLISMPVSAPPGVQDVWGCFSVAEERRGGAPGASPGARGEPDSTEVERRPSREVVRRMLVDTLVSENVGPVTSVPQESVLRVPDFTGKVFLAEPTPRGRTALVIRTTEESLTALESLRLDVLTDPTKLAATAGCPAPGGDSQSYRITVESTQQGRSLAVGGAAVILLIAVGAGIPW